MGTTRIVTVRWILYYVQEDRYEGKIFSHSNQVSIDWPFDPTYANELLAANAHETFDFNAIIHYNFPFGQVEIPEYRDAILLSIGGAAGLSRSVIKPYS